ncbi:hypothetical protein [Pectinatus brassicae]|uniref:CopG family transcriptional regulator/antitoxin EndoAI n=1 Tax=Pectinatus brassicae TaxID=862415 RepID=A0A840UDU4_9FIRM|nr:hypothetical protein [Pectinatus brassicae]MBB5335891.1 CopG family transcriptional regulator/antitoxin EndoAI [Pectinatus brassicae]
MADKLGFYAVLQLTIVIEKIILYTAISLLYCSIGGVSLSAGKRIVVEMPNELIGELDVLAQEEQTSHEEVLCKALRVYIKDNRHRSIIERMKKGYKEMGLINIALAEEGLYGGISKK